MKKKITSICLAAIIAVTAIAGASLAYFTSTDEAVNEFTVGDVKIDLIEADIHRVNAGAVTADGKLAVNVSDYTDGWVSSAPEAEDAYGWNKGYFTDNQIKASAEKYSEYLAKAGENIVPGRTIRKNPYVINTGKNDAYVRVRVLIPAKVDSMVNASMYVGTGLSNGAFTMGDKVTITKDNTEYVQYSFVYNDALVPGQMTFWNCWSSIEIADSLDNEDITASEFAVIIEADAIQAEGFSNAAEAFAAFDK